MLEWAMILVLVPMLIVTTILSAGFLFHLGKQQGEKGASIDRLKSTREVARITARDAAVEVLAAKVPTPADIGERQFVDIVAVHDDGNRKPESMLEELCDRTQTLKASGFELESIQRTMATIPSHEYECDQQGCDEATHLHPPTVWHGIFAVYVKRTHSRLETAVAASESPN